MVLKKKAFDLGLCIGRINSAVVEMGQINLQNTMIFKQDRHDASAGQTKPTSGWVKINCDGAFNKNEKCEKGKFC